MDLDFIGTDRIVYPAIQEKFIIHKKNYVNALMDRDGMDMDVPKYLNVLMENNGMYILILVNAL